MIPLKCQEGRERICRVTLECGAMLCRGISRAETAIGIALARYAYPMKRFDEDGVGRDRGGGRERNGVVPPLILICGGVAMPPTPSDSERCGLVRDARSSALFVAVGIIKYDSHIPSRRAPIE